MPLSLSIIIHKTSSVNLTRSPYKLSFSIHFIIYSVSYIQLSTLKLHLSFPLLSILSKIPNINISRLVFSSALTTHHPKLKFPLVTSFISPLITTFSVNFVIFSVSYISVSIRVAHTPKSVKLANLV